MGGGTSSQHGDPCFSDEERVFNMLLKVASANFYLHSCHTSGSDGEQLVVACAESLTSVSDIFSL